MVERIKLTCVLSLTSSSYRAQWGHPIRDTWETLVPSALSRLWGKACPQCLWDSQQRDTWRLGDPVPEEQPVPGEVSGGSG